MMQRFLDLPLGWAFLALWCGVMIRANFTYWIGRAIAAGTAHSRMASWIESPTYARAHAATERWGIIVVPISFVTVGFQTMVQLAAGVTRMSLKRYLPAVALGCAIWAAIYATVGMAVFFAWLETGGHWIAPLAVILIVMTVLTWRYRQQKKLSDQALLAQRSEIVDPLG
ncbi:DedA family protein [Actinomyces vulturis]|uniref:DedA family protein n=1 Tax=Actinomyces vulturis TaxID=1857645 RepID=UPI00082AB319|nr:VTT domain-containing protein [Actinomyces vulturis]